MSNPFRKVLDQCAIGFPLWQKWLMTGAVAIYVVSPVDALPDVIPPITWLDDLFMVYVLVRVWRSPTLPRLVSNGAAGLSRVGRGLRHHANDFVQGFKEGTSPK
jgi:uncharacterized membrane protein YkvA (DUF1232 family)